MLPLSARSWRQDPGCGCQGDARRARSPQLKAGARREFATPPPPAPAPSPEPRVAGTRGEWPCLRESAARGAARGSASERPGEWWRQGSGRVLRAALAAGPDLPRFPRADAQGPPQPGVVGARAATRLYHGDPLSCQPGQPRCGSREAGQPSEPPGPGEEEQTPAPPEEGAAAAAERVFAPGRLRRL